VIVINLIINIDVMVLLKKKLYKSVDDHDLEELARIFKYIPLAIVQATAYI
jgi:methylglyoxal synthase